jgi:hypothetical protein
MRRKTYNEWKRAIIAIVTVGREILPFNQEKRTTFVFGTARQSEVADQGFHKSLRSAKSHATEIDCCLKFCEEFFAVASMILAVSVRLNTGSMWPQN